MEYKDLTDEQKEFIKDKYETISPVLIDYALKEYHVEDGDVNDTFIQYVDMGDAGIWAKYPIGVTEWNEDWENQIKYFQWGDTEGYTKSQVGVDKQFTNWSDYKFSGEGATDNKNSHLTKYCSNSQYGENKTFTDNLTTLLPEDDACVVNMGGDWRMPTQSDFQKLCDSCTTEWVTDYNGVYGLNGQLFKLNSDESKQLFLPYSGFCNSGSIINVGTFGFFWSSSLDEFDPYYGLDMGFYSGDIGVILSDVRYNGIPILGFLGSGQ